MMGADAWKSAAPDAVIKPGVIMNTSLVMTDLSNLYAGNVGSIQLVPVPEPSHFALGLGVLGLGFVLWRRRRQATRRFGAIRAFLQPGVVDDRTGFFLCCFGMSRWEGAPVSASSGRGMIAFS
jgi:hypothetical protein